MEKTLKDKKILFISVKFFNYEILIKKQMEDLGAEVDWFDERPSNSFFTKAMIRLNKNVIASSINTYYRRIIDKIKNTQYDCFLLFKGEAVPKFFLEFLRNNNPNIKLIFYTWDSFDNNGNGLKIIDSFDFKYTFDAEDARRLNIGFRPLFFAEDYGRLYADRKEFENDIAFIGTAHSDRYIITEKIRNWCDRNGVKLFAFYFSPSKILFRYNKLVNKNFKLFDYKKISFNSLSHNDIIKIYKNSKIILDINHPKQKGLTMRTFESLGAGRKLITTNSEISKYPFYNKQNILIIDRNNIQLNKDFFEAEFREIEESLLECMSLRGFVEDIINGIEHKYWDNV